MQDAVMSNQQKLKDRLHGSWPPYHPLSHSPPLSSPPHNSPFLAIPESSFTGSSSNGTITPTTPVSTYYTHPTPSTTPGTAHYSSFHGSPFSFHNTAPINDDLTYGTDFAYGTPSPTERGVFLNALVKDSLLDNPAPQLTKQQLHLQLQLKLLALKQQQESGTGGGTGGGTRGGTRGGTGVRESGSQPSTPISLLRAQLYNLALGQNNQAGFHPSSPTAAGGGTGAGSIRCRASLDFSSSMIGSPQTMPRMSTSPTANEHPNFIGRVPVEDMFAQLTNRINNKGFHTSGRRVTPIVDSPLSTALPPQTHEILTELITSSSPPTKRRLVKPCAVLGSSTARVARGYCAKHLNKEEYVPSSHTTTPIGSLGGDRFVIDSDEDDTLFDLDLPTNRHQSNSSPDKYGYDTSSSTHTPRNSIQSPKRLTA